MIDLSYNLIISQKIIVFKKVHKMDQPRPENELQYEGSSNHQISYSRLAEEIDKEDEIKNSNNLPNQKNSNELMLKLNGQPRMHPMDLRESEMEEKHLTLDGPEIRIHYSSNLSEKIRQNTPLNPRMLVKQQEKTTYKSIVSSEHPKNITSNKLMNIGVLRPIIENESEYKRSDEEVADQQNILVSKITREIKINSLSDFTHIKAAPSQPNHLCSEKKAENPLFIQTNKDFNIRTIEGSVELQRNQPEKVVFIKRNNKEEPVHISRHGKEEDKRILSSLTTASKIIQRVNQPKSDQEIETSDDHYVQMMKRISKLESQVNLIKERKKNTSLLNNSKNRSSQSVANHLSSSRQPAFELNALIKREPERQQKNKSLHKKLSVQKYPNDHAQNKNRAADFSSEQSNEQLIALAKLKLWKQLKDALVISHRINAELKQIAMIFNLSRKYEVLGVQPFIALFQKQIMLKITYSQKIYVGQYEKVSGNYVKHGSGIEMDPLISVYKGEFCDGQKEGKGKFIVIDKYAYQGEWKGGAMQGKGILAQKAGVTYAGGFINGKKEGFGTEKLLNGDRYEGEFKNNQFHGKGLYFWSNGSEYKGEFKFNKMEGKGKWKSKLGDKYEGDFNNNLKEGWGVYSWRNGKVYEGEFVKGFQKKNHNHEEKAFKYEKIETKRRSQSPERFKVYFKQ